MILKLLLFSYDSLEESNTMVVDSINQQREKIKNLMKKIKNNEMTVRKKEGWKR